MPGEVACVRVKLDIYLHLLDGVADEKSREVQADMLSSEHIPDFHGTRFVGSHFVYRSPLRILLACCKGGADKIVHACESFDARGRPVRGCDGPHSLGVLRWVTALCHAIRSMGTPSECEHPPAKWGAWCFVGRYFNY